MPGLTEPDLAIAATAMGKLSSSTLRLPCSAARLMDLSTECPHQTTLRPASPKNLPLPSPCRAECGLLSFPKEPPLALSLQSRVWSARPGASLQAGGAESPNCCWGVVCSPGHRTLCVRAVSKHRKTCGVKYFTREVSMVHKVSFWILVLNSYACHHA